MLVPFLFPHLRSAAPSNCRPGTPMLASLSNPSRSRRAATRGPNALLPNRPRQAWPALHIRLQPHFCVSTMLILKDLVFIPICTVVESSQITSSVPLLHGCTLELVEQGLSQVKIEKRGGGYRTRVCTRLRLGKNCTSTRQKSTSTLCILL